MKIYQNVLSDESLIEIFKELILCKTSCCWGASSFDWDPEILLGVTGNCLFTPVNEELTKKIERELKNFLPPHEYLKILFYVWTANSGISTHDDKNKYSFAATLYLNEFWHSDYGGLFIWEEAGVKKVLVPQRNMLVVNDNFEDHSVSTINAMVPEPRLTLQIFGHHRI